MQNVVTDSLAKLYVSGEPLPGLREAIKGMFVRSLSFMTSQYCVQFLVLGIEHEKIKQRY